MGITENAVAEQVVDAACQIHNVLGPGLLESVYEAVLASELQKRGLTVARQQVIRWFTKAPVLKWAITALHKKQLLTYLRLADKRLGLLINFNVALIKDGITRIVNGLQE